MRITLDNVIEKSQTNDLVWLTKFKTRIKLIIKNDQLSEDVAEYLWNEVTLRRFLVKNQKLSDYLLEDVFSKTLANKKKFVSSAVYKETLIHQEIKDEKIEEIWNHCTDNTHYIEPLVILIKTIPQRALDVLSLNTILSLVGPGKMQIDDIISCCAAIINLKQEYITDISQKFLDLKDIGWIHHSMTVFAKISYFDDDLVNQLFSIVDDMSFYQILQTLMSRNNCSYSIQAKYLLNR